MWLGVLYIVVGAVLLSGGIAAIVYRSKIVSVSKDAQRRVFGEWIAKHQGSETPGSMLIGGVIGIVAGLWGIWLGICKIL